jgi:broad specificity phosphatase PhoE
MAKIYLVRHGQDSASVHGVFNGWTNTNLTELGRKQAAEAAAKLKDRDISVVYSSPLARAHETAEIIAEKLGFNSINIHGQLIERNFGVLSGKSHSDVTKYATKFFPTERVHYFLDAEGAESFPELLARARSVMDEIKSKYNNGENILIVAHGDIIKMLMAVHHGWSWEDGLRTKHIETGEIVELNYENKTA